MAMKSFSIFLCFSMLLMGCTKSKRITADDVKKQVLAVGDVNSPPKSEQWQELVQTSPDACERLLARVMYTQSLLCHPDPNFPENRKKIQKEILSIIDDAPDSWQAQMAWLLLFQTVDTWDECPEIIEMANQALQRARIDLLNNPQDPRLRAFLDAGKYEVADYRDFFILYRAYAFVQLKNQEAAQKDLLEIKSETYRKIIIDFMEFRGKLKR
ncbi:hypothetical protein Ga0100231_011750 [Opitutaceae bacterium TAV4]|nr:hypothetical protein Ga0100231_011750 [Opitutaceae bacterium TAV4]RRJ99143.1 hypothetical protein Ga0100230_012970 [Opitutaceae bacterium TAV3]